LWIILLGLRIANTYHRLREAEHMLNFTRSQLELTCEEVETRTHMMVHLKNIIETQDLKLAERAEMIATLKQQLLKL
jgi:predicted XRE-type DNA-binding protein